MRLNIEKWEHISCVTQQKAIHVCSFVIFFIVVILEIQMICLIYTIKKRLSTTPHHARRNLNNDCSYIILENSKEKQQNPNDKTIVESKVLFDDIHIHPMI